MQITAIILLILFICVHGLIVGLCSKLIHPGDDPIGCLPTIGIGISGSFIGSGINWLFGNGNSPLQPSGFVMSIIGGVLCCALWRLYSLKTSEDGPKSFFTGKRL